MVIGKVGIFCALLLFIVFLLCFVLWGFLCGFLLFVCF